MLRLKNELDGVTIRINQEFKEEGNRKMIGRGKVLEEEGVRKIQSLRKSSAL